MTNTISFNPATGHLTGEATGTNNADATHAVRFRVPIGKFAFSKVTGDGILVVESVEPGGYVNAVSQSHSWSIKSKSSLHAWGDCIPYGYGKMSAKITPAMVCIKPATGQSCWLEVTFDVSPKTKWRVKFLAKLIGGAA